MAKRPTDGKDRGGTPRRRGGAGRRGIDDKSPLQGLSEPVARRGKAKPDKPSDVPSPVKPGGAASRPVPTGPTRPPKFRPTQTQTPTSSESIGRPAKDKPIPQDHVGPRAPIRPPKVARPPLVRPSLPHLDWKPTQDARLAAARKAIDNLRPDIPLLLMPVRLETRFTTKGPAALRVRVFPDQIALDGLERRLTKAEVEEGGEFLAAYRKEKSETERQAMWAGFAGARDPWRAAWIVQRLQRGKPELRAEDDPESPALAPLLPERWLVTGRTGDMTFHAVGNSIPRNLAFSPSAMPELDVAGGLALDPALEWMVDFGAAVRVGMALEVPLPPECRSRIEELFVSGIVTAEPGDANKPLQPRRAAALLDRLLEAQHYDWGAGFVPAGTATNNTSDVISGWNARSPDLEAMRLREMGGGSEGLTNPSIADDGDAALRPVEALAATQGEDTALAIAARALGLGAGNALERFEHRQGTERAAARAMNRLLWPVTLGETFSTMLSGPEVNALDPAVIAEMRDWFCNDLTGGSPLPALRTGSTPYGLLPVESFSHRKDNSKASLHDAVADRLHAMLPRWQAAVPGLLRLAERPVGIDGFEQPGDRLIGILQQDSNPSGYHYGSARNLRGWPNDIWWPLGERIVLPGGEGGNVARAFQNDRRVEFVLTDDMIVQSSASIAPNFGVTIAGAAKVDFKADMLLATLWRRAAYTHYCEWPTKFRDVDHQLDVLDEKIALLDASLDPNSGIFAYRTTSKVKLKIGPITQEATVAFDIPADKLYARLIDPVKDDILTIRTALRSMRQMVLDHAEDSRVFRETFDPPREMWNGQLGKDEIDPRLTWLAFGETKAWPADALVEVDVGKDTVDVATWCANLAAYAQSFIDKSEAPAAPAFPRNRRPLLYQLIRTAIYQTATDAVAAASLLDAAIEIDGARPFDMERAELGDLLEKLRQVGIKSPPGGAKSAATPSRTTQAMALTLAKRKPEELRALSKRLASEADRKSGDPAFPAAEFRATAKELDRLAKVPRKQLEAVVPDIVRDSRKTNLRQMKNALDLIGQLNAAQVELLMQQTLGLASWRLDAWLTSLTARRLAKLRSDGAKTREGLQVGAFGWVEDLRANPPGATDAHAVRSDGFIHTPSPAHAKAAAVLRAGWQAYGTDDSTSPLTVDLSSERMRFAGWAFAAISQGQDAGDLLGREFERALRHRENAAEWIWPVRQAVLALTEEEADPELPVVDGLDLHRLHETRPKDLEREARAALASLGGERKADFAEVTNACLVLEERIDALADAGLAEAMFALVQGNPDRAGAQLSAISDGIRPPAALEMLSTAPPAMTQIHRVVILAPEGGGWVDPASGACPLAAADPAIEASAAALFGPATQLTFRYLARDAAGNKIVQGQIAWPDLIAAQSPFGGGALLAMKALPESGWSSDCEMALRLRGFLSERDEKLATAASIEIEPLGPAAGAIERIVAWRPVILGTRALHPRDCGMDGEEGVASIAVDQLETRAAEAEARFRRAAETVLEMLPAPVEGDPAPIGSAPASQVRKALLAMLASGWSRALSHVAPGKRDAATIYGQARQMAGTLAETVSALSEIGSAGGDSDGDARVRSARARLTAIFGVSLPFAVPFLPADPAGVARALGTADKRRVDPPAAARGWIERMAYVREPLRLFNDALLLTECDGDAPALPDIGVAQWPEDDPLPWIALAPPGERGGPGVSWAMLAPGNQKAPTAGQPLAGLVIDEVIDRVPASSVDTAIAMHFDAPNCEAPQALLLALPPEGEKWSYELLLDTLRDCFALARMRPVDSDVMAEFNAILPSIYGSTSLDPGGG